MKNKKLIKNEVEDLKAIYRTYNCLRHEKELSEALKAQFCLKACDTLILVDCSLNKTERKFYAKDLKDLIALTADKSFLSGLKAYSWLIELNIV